MYPGDSFGFLVWKINSVAVPGASAIKIIVRASIEDVVARLRQSDRTHSLPFEEESFFSSTSGGVFNDYIHDDELPPAVSSTMPPPSNLQPRPSPSTLSYDEMEDSPEYIRSAPSTPTKPELPIPHAPSPSITSTSPNASVSGKGINHRKAMVNIAKASQFNYSLADTMMAQQDWRGFVEVFYPYWAYDKRRAVIAILKTQFQGVHQIVQLGDKKTDTPLQILCQLYLLRPFALAHSFQR